jgi:hypothetical protein
METEMPKERIENRTPGAIAEVMVCWGDENPGDSSIELFVAPARAGGIYFYPDNPEEYGLKPGEGMGPIRIKLDRVQSNRLIRVMRAARDKTFGRDE